MEEARALDDKELVLSPDNLRCLYSLAANYAAQGNSGAAMACLNKAIAAGWIDYHSPMLDPRFDSIRNNEAFKNALSHLSNKVQEMKQLRRGRSSSPPSTNIISNP